MPDLGNSRTQFFTQTVAHPQDSTTAQVIISFTNLQNLVTLHIDMSNLTEDTTVEVFENVTDLVSTKLFPTDYDTGIEIIDIVLDGAGKSMNVTVTSVVAETSSENIVIISREETRN